MNNMYQDWKTTDIPLFTGVADKQLVERVQELLDLKGIIDIKAFFDFYSGRQADVNEFLSILEKVLESKDKLELELFNDNKRN